MLRKRLALTALESREVLSTTNLFDPGFYLARNPDVASAVRAGAMTAEDHFRRWGDAEGRSGNAVFDARVYLDDNPDVRDAVRGGRLTAFAHFEHFGQFEDRTPSQAFSPRDYLDDNPDVRAAARARALSAAEHFLHHGQFEDRLPFRGFDRSSYLQDNPDVANAVRAGLTTAVAHFTNFGRFENRRVATATPVATQPGQTTVFSGVSQDHDDKQFFRFTPPASGALQVVIQSGNGVFAQVEIEDAITSLSIFETEPNDGINAGSVFVTAGRTYLLRVRAPDDSPAQFTVRLTLS
jgi:hypothetical protein